MVVSIASRCRNDEQGHLTTVSGGLAAISDTPLQAGTYSTEGGALIVSDGQNEATYLYCAKHDSMVLTPPAGGDVDLVEGSILLQKQ